MKSISIQALLQQGLQTGLPRLDVQWLLLFALEQPAADRAWLTTHDTDLVDVNGPTNHRYRTLLARRQAGEPLAYITGHRGFYGLSLQVDARVLDPRPDTETLVDWALSICTAQRVNTLVDLGTGSGAIALALKQQRPGIAVSAIDVSAEALTVARLNGQRLGLNINWIQNNWLAGLRSHTFDLIVSNPPYIAIGDPHLAALTHEPKHALISGTDGLDDIRTIIAAAPLHLEAGGWLLLEHGHDQAPQVRALLGERGFTSVCSQRDMAGIERCSGGQWAYCATAAPQLHQSEIIPSI
jgi:release factor glutamine methyltransferase